jgi:UDP-2,4-diacetamido-2,4,6-trideoxy-beta-L-altropyranose hydrolase
MKFLIRCDSSKLFGFGHQMRCLSLAKMLRLKGHECVFLSKNLDGNISHLVIKNNFKLLKLDSKSHEVDDRDSLSQMKDLLVKETPQWVIVDSYFLGESWEHEVKDLGFHVMAIDDIFRPHAADIVLDQNFHDAPRYTPKRNQSLFLGPKYSLLDSKFKELIPRNWEQMKEVRSFTIFFGGSDHLNQTPRFLKILNRIFPDKFCNIVIGESSSALDEITKTIREIQLKCHLHVQTENMAQILHGSDLYIGAGGSVTWERSYLGIPSICYSVADNQDSICSSLHNIECHLYGGRIGNLTDHQIEEQIREFSQNQKQREVFHRNSLKLQVSAGIDDLLAKLEELPENRLRGRTDK